MTTNDINHTVWLESGIGRDMSDGEARELFMISRRERFQVGERLFQEGEVPSSFFLLCKGEVDIVKTADDSSKAVLASLGPGALVGEMSLLTKETRTASALITKESVVLRVAWKDFEELLSQSPQVAYKLMFAIARVMALRIHKINARLADLHSKAQNHSPHEQVEEFAAFKAKLLQDWSF